METMNIFKTLAAAMLMPAMLLITACSSEDDLLNTESTAKKGYTLPVTVNVTRQGDDATTRATYNSETKKLEFSAGDKLFVSGFYNDYENSFAGTLDYVSDGTFSGTITTETEWTGTTDELLADAVAQLLPAGYESYGYLSITENNGYDDEFANDRSKAITTSKATAVEQFSLEQGLYNSGSGFELEPSNAILYFTINGLETNTSVAVDFTDSFAEITTSGNVTTDGDGTATFSIGIWSDSDLKDCTLSVDGNDITLVSSSKYVEAGKIYNISRSVALVSYTECPDGNHPHWIDLGLTSGTLWQCCNEGADAPEGYGNYYTFDEAQSYNPPTKGQIDELLNNTTSEWTILNGVNGRWFTSKTNGGKVFLPAAGRRTDELDGVGSWGYYWSSTPYDGYYAYGLRFNSRSALCGYGYRLKQSVRPVRSN